VRNTEEIKVLITSSGGKIDDYYESIIERFKMQNQTIEVSFKHQGETMQQEFKELRKLLTQRGVSELTQAPINDVPGRRDAAFNKARQFYGTPPNATEKLAALQRSFVAGTDAWLSEETEYRKWLDGETPILWVSGDAGVGKSHLAYSAITTMQERAKSQPRTIVAYFFFQEVNEPFRSAKNALCSVGFQIVTQDRAIRETVANDLADECCTKWSIFRIWLSFSRFFKADSGAHLYLVLDGVDEACQDDLFPLLVVLNRVVPENLRMHVLLTGRDGSGIEELGNEPSEMRLSRLEVSLERSRMGLKAILDARFASLPRLSKFSRQVKEKISKALLGGNYGEL
jgi:hypothetical protein